MCAYPPAKKQLYIVDMQNLMYGSFPTETMTFPYLCPFNLMEDNCERTGTNDMRKAPSSRRPSGRRKAWPMHRWLVTHWVTHWRMAWLIGTGIQEARFLTFKAHSLLHLCLLLCPCALIPNFTLKLHTQGLKEHDWLYQSIYLTKHLRPGVDDES